MADEYDKHPHIVKLINTCKYLGSFLLSHPEQEAVLSGGRENLTENKKQTYGMGQAKQGDPCFCLHFPLWSGRKYNVPLGSRGYSQRILTGSQEIHVNLVNTIRGNHMLFFTPWKEGSGLTYENNRIFIHTKGRFFFFTATVSNVSAVVYTISNRDTSPPLTESWWCSG